MEVYQSSILANLGAQVAVVLLSGFCLISLFLRRSEMSFIELILLATIFSLGLNITTSFFLHYAFHLPLSRISKTVQGLLWLLLLLSLGRVIQLWLKGDQIRGMKDFHNEWLIVAFALAVGVLAIQVGGFLDWGTDEWPITASLKAQKDFDSLFPPDPYYRGIPTDAHVGAYHVLIALISDWSGVSPFEAKQMFVCLGTALNILSWYWLTQSVFAHTGISKVAAILAGFLGHTFMASTSYGGLGQTSFNVGMAYFLNYILNGTDATKKIWLGIIAFYCAYNFYLILFFPALIILLGWYLLLKLDHLRLSQKKPDDSSEQRILWSILFMILSALPAIGRYVGQVSKWSGPVMMNIDNDANRHLFYHLPFLRMFIVNPSQILINLFFFIGTLSLLFFLLVNERRELNRLFLSMYIFPLLVMFNPILVPLLTKTITHQITFRMAWERGGLIPLVAFSLWTLAKGRKYLVRWKVLAVTVASIICFTTAFELAWYARRAFNVMQNREVLVLREPLQFLEKITNKRPMVLADLKTASIVPAFANAYVVGMYNSRNVMAYDTYEREKDVNMFFAGKRVKDPNPDILRPDPEKQYDLEVLKEIEKKYEFNFIFLKDPDIILVDKLEKIDRYQKIYDRSFEIPASWYVQLKGKLGLWLQENLGDRENPVRELYTRFLQSRAQLYVMRAHVRMCHIMIYKRTLNSS